MENKTKRVKDLTGMKFGMLTVLGPAGTVGGKSMWRCRCDCGKDVVVRGDHLKSGHTISCGCVRGPGIRARMAKRTEGVKHDG